MFRMFLCLAVALSSQAESQEKIYVHSHEISLVGEKIHAYIQGEWIEVSSVHVDGYGLYVEKRGL